LNDHKMNLIKNLLILLCQNKRNSSNDSDGNS